MPPLLATLVCAMFVGALFVLNRERDQPATPAVWLPAIWMSLGATRMMSQWLGGSAGMASPEQYLEGSPLDRALLFGLLGAALAVLAGRARRARMASLVAANLPMAIFLGYCALSTIWSDVPFVAFKRWTKALGNIAMIMIVLSDPAPMVAIKRLFARTGFVLVPASVLLIKYYPDLGRVYDPWFGMASYTGVATGKNSLGALCLLLGIASLWRLLGVGRAAATDKRRQIMVHGAMVSMIVWLLWMAHSATSTACFVLGSAVLLGLARRRPGATPLPAALLHATALGLGLLSWSAQSHVIQALGRDVTLTGRTEMWNEFLALGSDPLVGTGFESFFLGPRAEYLWAKYWWHPNEAHNGYLEIYLTLGWVGVGLFAGLIVAGYRNAVRSYSRDQYFGALRLSLFAVAIAYNFTESATKVMHPIWIAFLLAATAVPEFATSVAQARPEKLRRPWVAAPHLRAVPPAQWRAIARAPRRYVRTGPAGSPRGGTPPRSPTTRYRRPIWQAPASRHKE